MPQIGTIRVETDTNGTVEVPVFDTGDSSIEVYEMVRVETDSGTGFIPVVEPVDSKYPYLRVQTENYGVMALHNDALKIALDFEDNVNPFSANKSTYQNLSLINNSNTIAGTYSLRVTVNDLQEEGTSGDLAWDSGDGYQPDRIEFKLMLPSGFNDGDNVFIAPSEKQYGAGANENPIFHVTVGGDGDIALVADSDYFDQNGYSFGDIIHAQFYNIDWSDSTFDFKLDYGSKTLSDTNVTFARKQQVTSTTLTARYFNTSHQPHESRDPWIYILDDIIYG